MTTSAEASAEGADLIGKIVLVAGDDALIGMDIEEILWGTLAGIQTKQPDVALLDVRLNDGAATPVADALTAGGVPFALLAGPDDLALLNGLASAPRVMKPFSMHALEQMLVTLLNRDGKMATAVARLGPGH